MIEARAKDLEPAPFADEACAPRQTLPDIVLVLSESGVVPSRIPGWTASADFDALYRSYDGAIHIARAETHGGGTWISEASVMSGLSMADFGWMRPYVTMLLKGRLGHGLPAMLRACGSKADSWRMIA